MAANRRQQSSAGNGGQAKPEPRQGFRAVGVAVSQLAAPILAKRGGGLLVRLKAEWAVIIGDDWSALAWPAALGRDGTLKLVSAPGAGLELQHAAPLLIERINLYFGRPLVTRLTQIQGPLPLPAVPAAPPATPLPPAEEAAIDERVAGIPDPELRAALARLGRAVAGARR